MKREAAGRIRDCVKAMDLAVSVIEGVAEDFPDLPPEVSYYLMQAKQQVGQARVNAYTVALSRLEAL